MAVVICLIASVCLSVSVCVCVCVCLSVCLSVCPVHAVTSESVDLESSHLGRIPLGIFR